MTRENEEIVCVIVIIDILEYKAIAFLKGVYFFLKKLIFIQKTGLQGEVETKKERSSIHWFILQMVTMTRAELTESYKPGSSSGSAS